MKLHPLGIPCRLRTLGAVLLASAALASIACGGRSAGPAPAAPAKAVKAEFAEYSDAEVAAVRDPHDHRGRPLCQGCHARTGELRAEPNAVCTRCHGLGHKNHPVAVVQKADARDLPLVAGRAVACHTCHDPHQKSSPLRKPFDELCLTCHPRH